MTQKKVSSFMVVGYGDNVEKAWEEFYINCEHRFDWFKGKKVWRSIPRLTKMQEFGSDLVKYRVSARVLALTKIPKGMKEAVVKGPYSEMPELREYERKTYHVGTVDNDKTAAALDYSMKTPDHMVDPDKWSLPSDAGVKWQDVDLRRNDESFLAYRERLAAHVMNSMFDNAVLSATPHIKRDEPA